MNIETIEINIEGYINCSSEFYSVADLWSLTDFKFTQGVNTLVGDIDSGIFGISYLISMYDKVDTRAVYAHMVRVNGQDMSLSLLNRYSCYLDRSYPLFRSNKSVRKLIEIGIKRHGMPYSVDDIRKMFELAEDRFEMSICATGNERYQAMAAIGFCNKKEVFCFPWLSKSRYDYFYYRNTFLMNLLASLGKVIIVPHGKS